MSPLLSCAMTMAMDHFEMCKPVKYMTCAATTSRVHIRTFLSNFLKTKLSHQFKKLHTIIILCLCTRLSHQSGACALLGSNQLQEIYSKQEVLVQRLTQCRLVANILRDCKTEVSFLKLESQQFQSKLNIVLVQRRTQCRLLANILRDWKTQFSFRNIRANNQSPISTFLYNTQAPWQTSSTQFPVHITRKRLDT